MLSHKVLDRDTTGTSEASPSNSGRKPKLILLCRFGIKLPRYQQIVNALTWMSHSQTLRRVSREYVIDLYLRPPVSRFRLMDFHLMDRIVRDANRYRPTRMLAPHLHPTVSGQSCHCQNARRFFVLCGC